MAGEAREWTLVKFCSLREQWISQYLNRKSLILLTAFSLDPCSWIPLESIAQAKQSRIYRVIRVGLSWQRAVVPISIMTTNVLMLEINFEIKLQC